MSLVGYKGRNHPQQVAKRGRNPEVDDRATTPEMFAEISARLGPFTIDVAAEPHNTKCERFFSPEDDGLAQPWGGERVWCNPPYSNIGAWVEKAHGSNALTVVMLLPANRTEQGWWQDLIEPCRDGHLVPVGMRPLRVEFLRGRPRFIRKGSTEVGANERPPFGCCLVIFTEWRRAASGFSAGYR